MQKRFVSEGGSAIFFSQETLNLLDPLDQAILISDILI